MQDMDREVIDRIFKELGALKDGVESINKRLFVGNGHRAIATQVEMNAIYIDEHKEEKKANRRMWKAAIIGQVTNIGLIISLFLVVLKLFADLQKIGN